VGDDVDGLGEADDRIADELAGTVPGDLAAAVKTASCSSSSSVSGRAPETTSA